MGCWHTAGSPELCTSVRVIVDFIQMLVMWTDPLSFTLYVGTRLWNAIALELWLL